jgi:hypothetical protein
MPFTFSHPALVLPLIKARLKLSATALIIGSMIPDFEYFIRMTDITKYSHTLTGIFWFDIPLALFVCFIYHLVVRNSLFDNLPSFLRERFSIYKRFDWSGYFQKNWAIVIVSIIIGAASHILWDKVTHNTMFYVKQADLSTMAKIGRINLAGYKFLQWASTIAGGLVVIYSIFALRRIHQPKTKIDYRYWALVWLITLSVIILRFSKNGFHLYYFKYYRVLAVSFISSLMIGLMLTPFLLKQKQRPGTKVSFKKKIEADVASRNQ